MFEHITDYHQPRLTPYGHQCKFCGGIYQHLHHVLDHFRRRHVFHWHCVAMPSQVHACPHCQLPFATWKLMDAHVMKEHNGSYGAYYREPDYVAVDYGDNMEELIELIDQTLIKSTNRIEATFLVATGSDEYRAIIKEFNIKDIEVDEDDPNCAMIKTIALDYQVNKFKDYLI